MKLRVLLMIGLSGFGGSVYAEGGSCPRGYYPVGGQGTQGCAPIPNYNSAGQQPQQQLPPQPTGWWETTWGAIAPSPKGGVLGTAVGAKNKEEAERLALADCVAKGGGSCEVRIAYHNQCAVMVLGDTIYRTARAGSIDAAAKIGIDACSKESTNCRVYYSACTKPIFHQY